MKVAGWTGFFILAIGIISSIFLIISIISGQGSNTIVSLMLGILFVVGYLSFIIFFYGFIKMGKHTGSRLLKNSSWIFLISLLVIIVLLIISFIGLSMINLSLPIMTGNVVDAYTSDFSDYNFDDYDLDDYDSNSYNSSSTSTNSTMAIVILILSIMLLIFLILTYCLFFIGLIDIGSQVRFSRAAGISGILSFAVSPLLWIIILITTVFASMASLFSTGNSGTLIFLPILSVIVNQVIFSTILTFLSLALFDASDKFENGKSINQYDAPEDFQNNQTPQQPAQYPQATLAPINSMPQTHSYSNLSSSY